MNNFKTGDVVKARGIKKELRVLIEGNDVYVFGTSAGGSMNPEDLTLVKPVDCDFRVGDRVYGGLRLNSGVVYTINAFTRRDDGVIFALIDGGCIREIWRMAVTLKKVPEQKVPAKAPEHPELKDGMFVEHKRYGIAKVVGSKDDAILKIPGFIGFVGIDKSMLKLPSPWTQEKLKADYRAARKKVWEESEAGKSAREKERILSELKTKYPKGLDLFTTGTGLILGGGKILEGEELDQIKKAWRALNPSIVDFWKHTKGDKSESPAHGFLSSIKVVTSEAIPKGAFMFGTINPSEAEERKKKEVIAGLTPAERSERNTLISFKDSGKVLMTSLQFKRLKELDEKMRKAAGDPMKSEIVRFKSGALLYREGYTSVFEVILDTGAPCIHVKNQTTGNRYFSDRRTLKPILDARISDTGKTANSKAPDIYTKTAEEMFKGADRLNAGKLQWSLVDFTALEPMVRVLMKGAKKYSPDNWKKGLSYTSILDSTMRHLTAFKAGEDLDPETGEPHTAHMLCNLMFLAWEELNRKDLDNRKPDLK